VIKRKRDEGDRRAGVGLGGGKRRKKRKRRWTRMTKREEADLGIRELSLEE